MENFFQDPFDLERAIQWITFFTTHIKFIMLIFGGNREENCNLVIGKKKVFSFGDGKNRERITKEIAKLKPYFLQCL